MAAFETECPSCEITTETTVDVDSGRRLGIAEGGQVRGRDTFEQPVFTIRFVIKTDLTGKADVDDFYYSYSDVFNTATIDDKGYSWLFSNKPMVTIKDGPIRFMEWDAIGYQV